jgi:hypothetical protein
MSGEQAPATKRRKSSESTSTATSGDPHPPLPSPPTYYQSPQHHVAQYPAHRAYEFAPPQHQLYRSSPPPHYSGMPPSGYPTIPPQHHGSTHGTVHHVATSSNSLVTPDSQQVASSAAAFASPPSSLRRQPFSSVDRGTTTTGSGKSFNRQCKFIHLLCWYLVVTFPFVQFKIGYLEGWYFKCEIWPNFCPM